ncbi:MAG: ABC transporter ATP-binding protein, partial [Propionibacteriaceae bacterium]|nr:ABC transporter ATP-binding protein [Propionibacteriaceae bacterium]
MSMSGSWRALTQLRQDASVKGHRLAPGTWSRALGFARPFAGLLACYLVLLVLDAVLAVVPALLFQRIIDDGVLAGQAGVVVW